MGFPPSDYIPTDSAVEGIRIYMPKPPEKEEQQETVDFSCPNCNATTAYSIHDGGLKCTACGYYEPPTKEAVGRGAEEFEFKVEVVEQAAHGWGETRQELQCQNCNAVTTLPEGSLTHTCPFCASSKVIQAQAKQDSLRPRFLIPIALEEGDIRPRVNEWLGASWMLPGKLQGQAKLGLFNAIYLPFWTFDARTSASWRAEVGYEETERYYSDGEWKTRTVVKWRWETGHVSLTFDDLLVSGTTHVEQGVLDAIGDYEVGKLAPYEPKYLAGINAQAYEIQLDDAWDNGRSIMRERTRQACEQDALSGTADRVRNMSMNLDFNDESWRYILLPVYLAAYRFGEEDYQIVVNAQTGTVSGTRPVDWVKVLAVGGAFFLPALLLGVIGLLLPPLLCVGGFAFIAAIAGVLWLVRQARTLMDPNRTSWKLFEGIEF